MVRYVSRKGTRPVEIRARPLREPATMLQRQRGDHCVLRPAYQISPIKVGHPFEIGRETATQKSVQPFCQCVDLPCSWQPPWGRQLNQYPGAYPDAVVQTLANIRAWTSLSVTQDLGLGMASVILPTTN
jgi:hypothetical protein